MDTAAACPSYWVVDPDGPAVVVHELRDGTYVEVARCTGDEPVTVDRPFDVSFSADTLLR